MEDNRNDIIYTAADIEKYHQGLLSAKEMHALEKAALDDPFLADALDGYKKPGLQSDDALADLKTRLAQRIQEKNNETVISPVKRMDFSWWKIAAMFILVAGAAFMVYKLAFDNNAKEIVHNPEADKVATVVRDTVSQNATARLSQDSNPALNRKLEEPAPAENTGLESETLKDARTGTKAPRVQPTNAEANPAPLQETVEAKAKEEEHLVTAEAGKKLEGRFQTRDEPRDQAQSLPTATDSVNARANNFAGMAARKKMAAPVQRNIFKGRITDAANNPLPFSNITNIEDNIGTYSDAKGNFILTSPDSLLKVQVSSVGFETSLIELHKGVPAHAVALNEDPNIPEVVIARSKVNTKRIRLQGKTPEEAEPQDGWDNYDTYLVNNTQLPGFMKDANQKSMGEVELSFEVDKDGKPQNIAVKKSLCSSCDQEAIRLVKEGPRWKRKAKKAKATVNIAF